MSGFAAAPRPSVYPVATPRGQPRGVGRVVEVSQRRREPFVGWRRRRRPHSSRRACRGCRCGGRAARPPAPPVRPTLQRADGSSQRFGERLKITGQRLHSAVIGPLECRGGRQELVSRSAVRSFGIMAVGVPSDGRSRYGVRRASGPRRLTQLEQWSASRRACVPLELPQSLTSRTATRPRTLPGASRQGAKAQRAIGVQIAVCSLKRRRAARHRLVTAS